MFSLAVVYPDDYDGQAWKLHLERVGRPEEPTKSRAQLETLKAASDKLVKALAPKLSLTNDLVAAETIIYVDTVDAGPVESEAFQAELARRARIFNEAPIYTRMQKGSWAYVLLYPLQQPQEYRSILAQLVSSIETDCANLFVADPRDTAFTEQLSRHLTQPLLDAQLRRELAAAQREISALKSQAPSSSEAQREQALQLEALTAQLANTTRRSTADIYALTTQLQESRKQAQAKEAELAAVQQQSAAAAAQFQQQLEAANQATAADRANFETWAAAKQQELETANSLVQGQAKKLGTVVPQLREASTEIAALRAQLEGRERELAELRAQMEGHADQLAGSTKELTGCREQLDSIITSGNAEFSRLSTELAGLSQCPGQFAICSQQLAQLQQEYQQLLEANQSLGQRIEELEAQLAASNADKQKLTLNIQEEVASRQELEAKTQTESAQEKQALQEILASSSDIQQGLQQQVDALTKENESLKSRNAQLTKRPDCTSAPEYLQLSEEKDIVETQLADKLEQYSQLEIQLAQLSSQLSAAQASVTAAEPESAAESSTSKAGKPLHEQISNLKRELADARDLIVELEAELKKVKEELKQAKETAKPADCSEIEQVAQQRQDLIVSQRKEIDKLQGELQQAKKEVSDTTYAAETQVLNLSASLDQCKDKVKAVVDQKDTECSTKLDETIEEHKVEIEDFKEKAKEAIAYLKKELETCAPK